jgi:membrane protein
MRAKFEGIGQIAANIWWRIERDNLTLIAAGVAFYAMTAIFPAIAASISIYGLLANPSEVQRQLIPYWGLLPASSLGLLTDAVQHFADIQRQSRRCYSGVDRHCPVHHSFRRLSADNRIEHRC